MIPLTSPLTYKPMNPPSQGKKITKKLSPIDKAKSKDRSAQLDNLLKIAEDPKATKADLSKVWSSTTSPKIRKAIAMNGNADISILKMSARLYVKEVLHNPTLELIHLFEGDPFVCGLKECYDDPKKAIYNRIVYKQSYNERNLFVRAMLLSKNLDYSTLSSHVLPSLSPTEFRRELNDKDVRDRIKKLITDSCLKNLQVKNRNGSNLGGLFKLGKNNTERVSDLFTYYKSGLISKDEIKNVVYMVGANTVNNYSGNSIAINLVVECMGEGDIESAVKLLLCGNHITMSSVGKKIAESDSIKKDIAKYAKAYVDCFATNIEIYASYGWKNLPRGSTFSLEYIYEAILEIAMAACFGSSKRKELVDLSKEELEAFRKFCTDIGFDKYASYYISRSMAIKDNNSLYALNECSDDVIKFYLYNNFVTNKLMVSTSLANVMRVLEDINQSDGIEKMAYNGMKLDYVKKVEYDRQVIRYKSLCRCGLDPDLIPNESIVYYDHANNHNVIHTNFGKYPYKTTSKFVGSFVKHIVPNV